MNRILTEEHGFYQIDFNIANEAYHLNEIYKTIENTLKDVDFIAETSDEIFLIEYKNTEVKGAKNQKINFDKLCYNVAMKYYGGAFYILSCKKNKPINFIFIFETTLMDSYVKDNLILQINSKLPFKLQNRPEVKLNLINSFKVLSINEWNEQYPMFPLTEVTKELVCQNN